MNNLKLRSALLALVEEHLSPSSGPCASVQTEQFREYAQAPSSPSKPKGLVALNTSDTESATERLSRLVQRVESIGNRVYGVRPTAQEPGGATPSTGEADAAFQALEQLRVQLSRLEDAIERVEQI